MRPKEISPIDFAARRKAVAARLGQGLLILPSAAMQIRNNDVSHPYRQDSSFFYLTGFDEPHSLCLLAPASKTPFQMFVQPRDKTKELWEGKILGPEWVKTHLKADAAFPSTPEAAFDEAFMSALETANAVYYRVGQDPKMDRRVFRLMQQTLRRIGRTGRPFWPIHDPQDVIGEMRLYKTKPEIDRLQHAANITADAHVNAMKLAKPGMFEYEIEAVLYHGFRINGAGRLGYPSIVASGPNACVLHYHAVDRKIGERELLLIDAGAEFDYYTADITRVFPVGGGFTAEQKDVYGAVLKAQKSCIGMIRPGCTLNEIHNHAVEALTEELKRLKVLKGPTAQLIKKKAFFPYYPHGTGHWLGMDVHDCGKYYNGSYDRYRKLEPGMVFTVEPGLYFGAEASTSPARYKGIGVRIEDDVLVTSSGCKVLTSGVPKEIEEIESLCASS